MKDIKGTTNVCCLIGNPVAHSISPFIHNTLAQLRGDDLVYVPFKVEENRVEEAVKGAYALNVLGMNVTVPHKQHVLQALVETDSIAQAIGAVNTLVRTTKDGISGYKGYNTDILGLERELEDVGVSLKDKEIVLLGAGGAARAIAFLCVQKGASQVVILNRTISKANSIAVAVNQYFNQSIVKAMDIKDYDKMALNDYIAIQTTSVGLHPNNDDVIICDDQFYKNAAAGVDIIYNPSTTKFMKLMHKHGKPAYNGLKMLLYQGIAAYELWLNCTITKEMADKVYDVMEKNCFAAFRNEDK